MRPDVSTPSGPAGASWLRQKPGPGKYASSATPGWKTMCGTRPSAHCPRSWDSSSRAARPGSSHDHPIAMKAASQPHWCGYWRREGTVEPPVQLPSRTEVAAASSGA